MDSVIILSGGESIREVTLVLFHAIVAATLVLTFLAESSGENPERKQE